MHVRQHIIAIALIALALVGAIGPAPSFAMHGAAAKHGAMCDSTTTPCVPTAAEACAMHCLAAAPVAPQAAIPATPTTMLVVFAVLGLLLLRNVHQLRAHPHTAPPPRDLYFLLTTIKRE
ncbi:MAG: hypothetical protein Q7T01_00900 [bacterium]|nr:hypothetical protein [bacterium]